MRDYDGNLIEETRWNRIKSTIINVLVIGIVMSIIIFILYKTFEYSDDSPKWENSCSNHVIISSYSRQETETDSVLTNGFSVDGKFVTGFSYVDRPVTNYYILLDDNTIWSVPRNLGPYIKTNDLSNKYCNVENIDFIK